MLFSAKKPGYLRRMYRENPERLAWIIWGSMALVVLVLLFLTTGQAEAQPVVSDEILRLHVVANSDSQEDQAVKLKVRDAIQAEFAALWQELENAEDCRQRAQESLADVEQCAERVLEEQGFPYGAGAQLGVYAFPDREYGDVVMLPEGRYWAVRVTLGEGAGANWWCVLYPPLCVSSPNAEERPQVRSWVWEQLPERWQHALIRFWTGGKADEA